ncbi:MAG: type II toxin-antitoxin system HicA family toxin [Chloroflexi bacterium]|nr:type II toxin-antitoxin system HicA family toxin [Chloroflexota bacterium]
MRHGELVRKLRRLGVDLYRQARGSHEIWWHPETGRRTAIRNHPSKEIASRTLHKILQDLGLRQEDLEGL